MPQLYQGTGGCSCSYRLSVKTFPLSSWLRGMRPAALPAVPGQICVGFPCKCCTTMARVVFPLREAAAFLPWVTGVMAPERAALARCVMGTAVGMRDFVYQLYSQSFTLCLDSSQPRAKPHQEMRMSRPVWESSGHH